MKSQLLFDRTKNWIVFVCIHMEVPLFILEDLYWTNQIISSKLASIRCRANSNFNHFLKFTPERSQSNAWLQKDQHKILNKLSRRLEHIIGLQVSNVEDIILASEAYQVKVALSWKVFFFHFGPIHRVSAYSQAQNKRVGSISGPNVQLLYIYELNIATANRAHSFIKYLKVS